MRGSPTWLTRCWERSIHVHVCNYKLETHVHFIATMQTNWAKSRNNALKNIIPRTVHVHVNICIIHTHTHKHTHTHTHTHTHIHAHAHMHCCSGHLSWTCFRSKRSFTWRTMTVSLWLHTPPQGKLWLQSMPLPSP